MGVSIREKPKDSGVWWVFVNHRGTRKARKVGKDKRLAQEVKRKIEAKLTLGDLDMGRFNQKVPTLKQYAKKWLALPHKRRWKTQEGHTTNLERHIYPVLGDMPIDQIKRRDIKGLFDKLLIKGISESSFKTIKSPLNQIFNHALDAELIDKNPVEGLRFSNKRTIDIKPLTEEQAYTLLEKAQEHREGLYYPHILTLLRTGVRIGELIGLQWGDIDFKERTLTVERTVKEKKVGPTKNGKSRTVDMTPHLTETLKTLKVEKQKYALKTGTPFSDWVFSFKGRCEPLSPKPIRENLRACLKKAELPMMRVHDIRHTYATIRLLRGHDIGDVSYQLGHTSIQITFDIYGHWIPGNFKAQVDDLDMQPGATYTQPEAGGE